VFVSKIVNGGAAAACGRLRIGDRILRVNDVDVANARHEVAVKALVSAGRDVQLLVRHDRQPAGLRKVVITRKVSAACSAHAPPCVQTGEPLGLSICGGINAPPANVADPTDEGIFVDHVHPEGATARSAGGRLRSGTRIIEVNEHSLLGCTHAEAAEHLRAAIGVMVELLVCDGFEHTPMSPAQSPHANAAQVCVNPY
jgi:C-terminal processing protease CtpA/Prc